MKKVVHSAMLCALIASLVAVPTATPDDYEESGRQIVEINIRTVDTSMDPVPYWLIRIRRTTDCVGPYGDWHYYETCGDGWVHLSTSAEGIRHQIQAAICDEETPVYDYCTRALYEGSHNFKAVVCTISDPEVCELEEPPDWP
jgi:hypothetical protein